VAGNAHNEPRTDEEWLEYVQRDDVDSIRSRSDWDRRLRDGDFRGKLFPGCDDETVEEFSNGLVVPDHDGYACHSFGPVPSSATRWQATRAPAGPTGRSGGTSLRHRSSTTGQRV
jgi:hypothetical protein